jgi:putative membrane protein
MSLLSRVATALTVFVALQHLGFFVLESFLWTSPVGLAVFEQTADQAAQTAVLARNQGVYNAFLSVGLLWSTWGVPDPSHARQTRLFFLGCVVVAGLVGGFTASPVILLVQALPALLAVGATVATGRSMDRPV